MKIKFSMEEIDDENRNKRKYFQFQKLLDFINQEPKQR